MTPQLYAILGVGLLLVVDAVLLVWLNNRAKDDSIEFRVAIQELRSEHAGLASGTSKAESALSMVEKSLTDLHKYVTAPKPEPPAKTTIIARNWREAQTLMGTGEDNAA